MLSLRLALLELLLEEDKEALKLAVLLPVLVLASVLFFLSGSSNNTEEDDECRMVLAD